MMNGDEAEQTDRMREEGWMRPLIEGPKFYAKLTGEN